MRGSLRFSCHYHISLLSENNFSPNAPYVTRKTSAHAASLLGQSGVLCLYWLRVGYLSGQFKKAICSFSPILHLHGFGVCSGTQLNAHQLQATQMKMSIRSWRLRRQEGDPEKEGCRHALAHYIRTSKSIIPPQTLISKGRTYPSSGAV